MINLIRGISATAASIFFIILMFRIFGDINHRKALGVIFLFGACIWLMVFISLSKFNLDGRNKRILGAVSLVIATIFTFSMIINGVNYTISTMTGKYGKEIGLIYWIGLITSGLVPWLAFRYDALAVPIANWLSAKDSNNHQ